jgi:hypothetical protein
MAATNNQPDKSDFYQFGPHFRTLSQERGLSLKEAAGNTMSVTHLSNFELGKKTITMEKFSDLLMNIGVDFSDYFQEYAGQRLTSYAQLYFADKLEEIPRYYQNFPTLIEPATYFIELMKQNHMIIPELTIVPDELIQLLLDQEVWNELELDSFKYLMMLNNLDDDVRFELIKHANQQALENIKKIDYPSIISTTSTLLMMLCDNIRLLSRAGHHQLAFDTITKVRTTLNQYQLRNLPAYFYPLILLDIHETYTLIRVNRRTDAFQKRKQIIQILDTFIDYYSMSELTKELVSIKARFQSNYAQLMDGRLK